MRHLGSLVLALVVAAIGYGLTGRGAAGMLRAANQVDGSDWFAGLAGFGMLIAAGLLYTLLVLVRFSPLGPVLAGLSYLGIGVWALVDAGGLAATLPGDLVGLGREDLVTGAVLAPLLAMPLLFTIFSARRWRGRDLPLPGQTVYGRPTPAADTLEHAAPSAPAPGGPDLSPVAPTQVFYPGGGPPERAEARSAETPPSEEPTEVHPSNTDTYVLGSDSPTQPLRPDVNRHG